LVAFFVLSQKPNRVPKGSAHDTGLGTEGFIRDILKKIEEGALIKR